MAGIEAALGDGALASVLDEFSAAFHAQDAARLRAVFAEDEVSFIASEAIVLHDRGELEHFIDAYTAGAASFSFDWDRRRDVVVGDVGWIVAFGHETAHLADGDERYPFRMTLLCLRSDRGWRIAQLHASTPVA